MNWMLFRRLQEIPWWEVHTAKSSLKRAKSMHVREAVTYVQVLEWGMITTPKRRLDLNTSSAYSMISKEWRIFSWNIWIKMVTYMLPIFTWSIPQKVSPKSNQGGHVSLHISDRWGRSTLNGNAFKEIKKHNNMQWIGCSLGGYKKYHDERSTLPNHHWRGQKWCMCGKK